MRSFSFTLISFFLKVVVLFFILLPFENYAQLSQGGIPYSFKLGLSNETIPLIKIASPDPGILTSEDERDSRNGSPYRYAVNIPFDFDILKNAVVEELSNGNLLYSLSIQSKDALALGLYFDSFYLPESCILYIYSADKKQVIGGFSFLNNQDNGRFATELLHGDKIILEYYETAAAHGLTALHLSELSYAYRGFTFRTTDNTRGFGGSDACEVNINCPEGQNWQGQKRGIVRIAIKVGASSFWCTGTMLNNVTQDYKPYLLTADHCGSTATEIDISQWIFYFNYESLDCTDPIVEPGAKTLTGAKKKACSGGGGTTIKESDFYLVLLNNYVPDNYNTFYCGWNRLNNPSPDGVCIHHPEGDIKKISTYLVPIVSASWGSTPGSHWSVKWASTQSGHGVTEPGSSGSPLLNSQGEVIGQLSGGEASCTNLTATDLFGKFFYSWQPMGSDSSNSLHYWLDPVNSGALNIPGLSPNFVYVVANFTADRDTFVIGNTVNFTDLSSGNPNSWKWTFPGGEPSSSTEQHPKNIAYNKAGVYKVSLIATNTSTSDTLEKLQYITVLPHIYPNPTDDHFIIDLGNNSADGLKAEMYDVLGREVNFYLVEVNPGSLYNVYIKNNVSGMYYLRMKTAGLDLSKKIMFINTVNH